MVERSREGSGVGQQVLAIQQRVFSLVLNSDHKDRKVPAQIISDAETKLEQFKSLKAGINSDVALISDRLEQLRQKITANSRSSFNPNGLLTKAELDYHSALRFLWRPFNDLIEQDATHWALNLEKARIDANKL